MVKKVVIHNDIARLFDYLSVAQEAISTGRYHGIETKLEPCMYLSNNAKEVNTNPNYRKQQHHTISPPNFLQPQLNPMPPEM